MDDIYKLSTIHVQMVNNHHLAAGVTSEWSMFADDFKMYSFSSIDDESYFTMASNLQRDILVICKVAESWGLTLAPNKCVRLRFCRPVHLIPDPFPLYVNSIELLVSDYQRDLGVIVDSTLKFHHHVSSITTKASGVVTSLLSSTVNRTPEFMRSIYISHIRPLLEFASPLWNVGFLSDSRKIESVQRRWTKRISGLEELPYEDRLRRVGLYSMKGRRLRADLILTWKILSGNCPTLDSLFSNAYFFPPLRTRGHSRKLFLPRVDTDIRSRFFSVRVVPLWNSLPEDVVSSPSLVSFKTRLHAALCDKLYEFD